MLTALYKLDIQMEFQLISAIKAVGYPLAFASRRADSILGQSMSELRWDDFLSTPVSPVSVTPPTLRTHLHLHDKGKAIPVQPWTGPVVSRRLRLPDSNTIDT